MKKLLLAVGVGVLALSSCKEKPPYINLTAPTAGAKVDTTYVLATLPAAEPHNILIENFTGATCSNCPAAHDVLHNLDSIYSGRLNIVSLYIKNFSQTEPPENAKYDFRTDGATDIMKNVFPYVGAMPCAGIDRLPIGDAGTYGNSRLIGRNFWNTYVPDRVNTTDSINLTLVSTYDSAARIATVNLKVIYLESIGIPQNYSIVVVEDGFIDVQEFPTYFDEEYHFNHIYRGSVTTGAFGDAILPSMVTKEKGRVYDVTYRYAVSADWKPRNCRFVAYVNNGAASGGSNVYQSKSTKMVP